MLKEFTSPPGGWLGNMSKDIISTKSPSSQRMLVSPKTVSVTLGSSSLTDAESGH